MGSKWKRVNGVRPRLFTGTDLIIWGHRNKRGLTPFIWFDANRCYQRASSVAQYLGQAVLTRSNPLVCQLVVYRGKAQGRKHYTYAGNVAQGFYFIL